MARYKNVDEKKSEIVSSDWADFLRVRADMIIELRRRGRSFDQIAETLSCDPVQCQLIYMARTEEKE